MRRGSRQPIGQTHRQRRHEASYAMLGIFATEDSAHTFASFAVDLDACAGDDQRLYD